MLKSSSSILGFYDVSFFFRARDSPCAAAICVLCFSLWLCWFVYFIFSAFFCFSEASTKRISLDASITHDRSLLLEIKNIYICHMNFKLLFFFFLSFYDYDIAKNHKFWLCWWGLRRLQKQQAIHLQAVHSIFPEWRRCRRLIQLVVEWRDEWSSLSLVEIKNVISW